MAVTECNRPGAPLPTCRRGVTVWRSGAETPRNPSPDMARTALPAQSTVSEWLKATVEIHQSDKYALTKEGKAAWKLWKQFRLISANDVERETEKAIGVRCTYWNSCANAKPGTAWIPKSQIKEIANDYWTNPDQASRFYLVPTWLINAKKAEGYEI